MAAAADGMDAQLRDVLLRHLRLYAAPAAPVHAAGGLRGVPGLTLAGFGGLASGPALSFWTESIVMEFVAGMLVGRLYLDGRLSFSTPASAALVVAGGVLLVAATPWAAPQTRLLAWGLPALMIVIGTLKGVAGKPPTAARQGRAGTAGRRLLLDLPDAYRDAGRAPDLVEHGWLGQAGTAGGGHLHRSPR